MSMPRPEVRIMVGQWTSQVRKMVGIHTGSRQMTLMRVMLGLALCAAHRWLGTERGGFSRE